MQNYNLTATSKRCTSVNAYIFTEFIQANLLTSEQEEYLKSILDYVCQNGDMQKDQLIQSPFDDYQVLEIFPGKFPKVAEFVTLLHKSITAA